MRAFGIIGLWRIGRATGSGGRAGSGFDAVATVEVTEIQLIRIGRDQRLYERDILARVPLGTRETASP